MSDKEEGDWQIMLKKIIILYNLRTRMMEINKIKNVYMHILGVDANEKTFM